MNDWIDVKDRLPHEKERVLVCSVGTFEDDRIYISFYCWGESVFFPAENVTHWMLLPDLPEVKP